MSIQWDTDNTIWIIIRKYYLLDKVEGNNRGEGLFTAQFNYFMVLFSPEGMLVLSAHICKIHRIVGKYSNVVSRTHRCWQPFYSQMKCKRFILIAPRWKFMCRDTSSSWVYGPDFYWCHKRNMLLGSSKSSERSGCKGRVYAIFRSFMMT